MKRRDAAKKDWLRQANAWPAQPWPGDNGIASAKNDTEHGGFTPKVSPGHPDYKSRVAEPTMAAVDDLPAPYRALVHAYDYIDVYRAWKRRWPPDRIKDQAVRAGGRLIL